MAGQVLLAGAKNARWRKEWKVLSLLISSYRFAKVLELPHKQNFFLLPGVDICEEPRGLNIF